MTYSAPLSLTRSAATFAGVVLLTYSAEAAPPERLAQVELDRADPCHIGLRYDNGQGGLLISRDGGRTFRLRCSASFDEAGEFNEDALAFGFGAEGAPLVGSFAGLANGDAQACNFEKSGSPLASRRVTDFTHHPSDATLTYLTVSSASAGERTGIVARDAAGTLSEVGASDTADDGSSRFFANRLRLAVRPESTGGVRFYESGLLRTGDGSLVPAVRYSDDGAETWTEFSVDEASNAGAVLLWAVDPGDPARILLTYQDATGAGSGDTVLVSSDGGETRTPWITDPVSEVSAVAVAEDGTVWLGDSGSATMPAAGLWTAASMGDTPAKLDGEEVRCLVLRPQDGALFGCRTTAFGRIDPSSGELTPLYNFSYTAGFVECPGEDLATRCESQLCEYYCGPLHYAEAPLCEAYDEPLCGPEADTAYLGEGGKDVPALPHVVDPLCPHPDDGTVSPTDDAGAGSGADGSVPAADSGTEGGPGGDGADGGGSSGCNALPATTQTLPGLAWLALVALWCGRRFHSCRKPR